MSVLVNFRGNNIVVVEKDEKRKRFYLEMGSGLGSTVLKSA